MIELLSTREGTGSQELFVLVHRFAGTAGTFGFEEAGQAAQFIDREIAEGRTLDANGFEPLLRAVEKILRAA